MTKLNKEEIEFITKCLEEGKSLPDSYNILFLIEAKKEYELTYADKEQEEDILADTIAVPLQPVKTFGNNKGGWTNKLIFGDNLQVMKALMDDLEVYDKNTGRGKVKLIYIDPPLGTGDIYDAKGTTPAYSAKLQGAKFIEFLRKRLVFLKEILTDDGSIYVRIDYHFGHYLKAVMDEIFEKNNFRNELLINRTKKSLRELVDLILLRIQYFFILKLEIIYLMDTKKKDQFVLIRFPKVKSEGSAPASSPEGIRFRQEGLSPSQRLPEPEAAPEGSAPFDLTEN